ncbi:hypothetical protein PG993_001766 [Apiospora rasikravindrae]|uniref:PXA domain-containing protein n=1 Tax=Apiospora rasikravindrae TaxID=990691 RepID=A0ABR1UF83_9PEZI
MASTTPRSLQNSAVPTPVNATTESTLLAASRPSTPARISSPRPPPPSNLRNARPVSTDFLSDKATIALIRRVLCAQSAADRGRSTPAPIEELLPPLTSRNDVDLQLYAFISIIIRDYVQTWYSKITPDETFVAEIVQIIAHCTRSLEQRLREVDLESLLLDELPELLDAHVRAYRTARTSVARSPVETNHREIYHALCPLPALSPVPKRDDPRSLESQADNEVAYRQLLVQGLLALLLPTEDLENECLTSLVGQIFSELIIGNLFVNKLSEPWMLLEILIIVTRLADKGSLSDTAGSKRSDGSARCLGSKQPRVFSISRAFWSLIQWGFLAVSLMRAFITTMAQSRSLPPRPPPSTARMLGSKNSANGQKQYDSLADHHIIQAPVKVPIAQFSLWPCLANLLEMDVRMPWLGATLSLLQWGAVSGPGRVAGYDGFIDRLLWHSIQSRLLDPARLPPLLRTIRAAVFPNNAPGTPSLVAPSSDEELAALRRRCASAVWALVPKMVNRLYFGSSSPLRARSSSPSLRPTSTDNTGTEVTSGDVDKTSVNPHLRTGPPITSVANSSESKSNNATLSSSNKTSTKADPPSSAPKLEASDHARLAQLDGSRAGNVTSAANSRDLVKKTTAGPGAGNVFIKAGEMGSVAATAASVISKERPPLATAGAGVDGFGPEVTPWHDHEDDDRILSEIETGILDVFSDAYCNKHLIYGILELILVRLMPELAERGVIDLWEERLS